VSLGDQEAVLVDVDLADLVAIGRLEDDTLAVLNALHEHLGK